VPPGESKKIRIGIEVDERQAANLRRTIQGVYNDWARLMRLLNGQGGPNMASLFGVGSAPGVGRSSAQSVPGARGSAATGGKNSLASAMLENANALKSVAKTGGESMRVMSESVSRAIDQQRRHIRDLDNDLAKLSRRYGELSNERGAAIVGGVHPDAAGGGMSAVGGRMAGLYGRRAAATAQLQQLQDLQHQVSPPYLPPGPLQPPPPPGGGGFNYGESWFGKKFPVRDASGRLFRPGFAAGAIGAGVVAGANELIAQPFDVISNQARQAQAIGGMGVATKQGDLSFVMALSQVLKDPEKRKEIGLIGERSFSYGISGAAGSLKGVFQGDPNVPGGLLRSVMNLDSRQKEAFRSYIDQQIQSDPNFYANLNRFQSEAGGRLGIMRRAGIGERNLSSLLQSVGYGSGQDIGDVSSAFEALRPGGRGFAAKNLGAGLSAARGGMDLGALSALTGAGSRKPGDVLRGLSGVDVVGAEHLAQAIAGALRGSGYGSTSGLGMLGAMTGVGFGDRPEFDVYRAGQRANAVPGMAALLGGGADPFGRGVNVLAANRIVGPGGDFYKARALAQLGGDPAALFAAMNGDINGLMSAQGITQSNATQMFQESVTRNVRSRFVSGAGGTAASPATATMQRLVDVYGGDPRAMFGAEGKSGTSRERLLDELGVGMSEILPQTFSSAAQGREAMAALIGARGPGRKGKGFGDAGSKSLARAYTAGRLGAGEEDMGQFLRSGEAPMLEAFSKVMKPLGDTMLRMGDMDQSAEKASASLLALVTATEALRASFDRMSKSDRSKAITAERQKLLGEAEAAKAAAAAAATEETRKHNMESGRYWR
jgi:hypothetical protein